MHVLIPLSYVFLASLLFQMLMDPFVDFYSPLTFIIVVVIHIMVVLPFDPPAKIQNL